MLALELGIPVAELQERISFEEFLEWRAFYDLDPFGYQRHDLNTGIILAHVMSAMGAKNVKPSDFMPNFERLSSDNSENVKRMATMFQAFMSQNPDVKVRRENG